MTSNTFATVRAGLGLVTALLNTEPAMAQQLDRTGHIKIDDPAAVIRQGTMLPEVRFQRLTNEYAGFLNAVRSRLATNAPVYQEVLNAAILAHDWIELARRNPELSHTSTSAAQSLYFETFVESIRKDMDLQTRDPKEAFLALKIALDSKLSAAWYNASATNIYDGFIPGPDGKTRFDCTASSALVMAVMRELMPQTPKGTELVYVYLPGHRASGILTPNELIFSEATTTDGLVRVSRNLIGSNTPMTVVKADSADLLRYFGVGTRKEAILIDTTDPHAREMSGFKPGISNGKSHFAVRPTIREERSTGGDLFAFGKADVPPGDIKRQPAGKISLTSYYSSRPGASEGAAEGSGMSSADLEKYVDLFKALRGKELSTVKAYLSHTSALSDFYDQHVPIMNDPNLSFQEKGERVEAIRKQARSYIDQHGLLELYRESAEILRSHQLEWAGNIHPIGIHDVLANNAAYARAKAR